MRQRYLLAYAPVTIIMKQCDGYKVLNTGYFVYCNGKTDVDKFNGKLEFTLTLIAYEGDDSWVSGTIKDIHKCLNSDTIPESEADCDLCVYRKAASEVLGTGS